MDCIFCKIINKELESNIIYEDDSVICLEDINPKAPVHALVIPKKHIENHLQLKNEDEALLGHLHMIINEIARKTKIDIDGFRLVLNCKEKAGQTVNHLHFHLMGGRNFNWPPG